MKCPYCHEELGDDPGGFCDFCGKSLTVDKTPVAKMSTTEQLDAQENSLTDIDAEISMPSSDKATSASEPHFLGGKAAVARHPFNLEVMADGILTGNAVQDTASCRYFSVWYATNRFLLAGGQMLLDLKVKITDSSVRNMQICLMTVIGEKTQLKRVPCDELSVGGESELSVSLYLENEKINGLALLKIFFLFDTDEGKKCCRMDVRSKIYARGQSVQSIVMNLQAESGSVNDLSGIHSLEGICHNGDELLERANAEAPQFTAYRVVEIGRVPDNVMVFMSSYVCDMLTIEWRGRRYHLCGKVDVSIGRKWDMNDFALVDWVNTQSDKDDFNRHTSKRQAQFHWCGDAVNLIDLSTNGTFVDGKLPEASGAGGIRLPEQAVLKMGNFKLDMTIQKCGSSCGYSFCDGCTAAPVRAVTLRRLDKVPECFILVWECCDLGGVGMVDERGGVVVYHRNGGFFCRLPDGSVDALAPGLELPWGGDVIRVTSYHRNKFEKLL